MIAKLKLKSDFLFTTVQATDFDSLHHFTLRSPESKNLAERGPYINLAKFSNRLFESTAAKVACSRTTSAQWDRHQVEIPLSATHSTSVTAQRHTH
jgi:hypothetical protein